VPRQTSRVARSAMISSCYELRLSSCFTQRLFFSAEHVRGLSVWPPSCDGGRLAVQGGVQHVFRPGQHDGDDYGSYGTLGSVPLP
jgi:hypothetical protein